MKEQNDAVVLSDASVIRGSRMSEKAEAHGVYTVQCLDADGNVKWTDHIDNVVTTVGKNNALDEYLAGTTYTAAWYIGLISSTSYTTGPDATDTSASHGGWAEDTQYDEANRPTTAWSAASGGSKALSSALSFTISASTTIKGCFLIDDNTKGGTTGVLYSAGLFSGGDKVVADNDTLNVSYTASL